MSSGSIGEAFIDFKMPEDQILAAFRRAEQIARTETEKIQRTVNDKMRGTTFLPVAGGDVFGDYSYAGGPQGLRTNAGLRDFAFRESRARQNLRNVMQEMAAYEATQIVPETTPGSPGWWSRTFGGVDWRAGLRGIPGFRQYAGPAAGLFAVGAISRIVEAGFTGESEARAEYVRRNGRMPGPGDVQSDWDWQLARQAPLIGWLFRGADALSNYVYDVPALSAQYERDQKQVDAFNAATKEVNEFVAALRLADELQGGGREEIAIREEYNKRLAEAKKLTDELTAAEQERANRTIQQAKDTAASIRDNALRNAPKVPVGNWYQRTMMGGVSQAYVVDPAAAQAINEAYEAAVIAAEKGVPTGGAAGRFNEAKALAGRIRDASMEDLNYRLWRQADRFGGADTTDPEQREIDELTDAYTKQRDVMVGHYETAVRLEERYEQAMAAIRQKHRDQEADAFADWMIERLQDQQAFLQDTSEIDKRYRADRIHMRAAVAGGEGGRIAEQIYTMQSQYDALAQQYADDPEMLKLIQQAREAEIGGMWADYQGQQASRRRAVSRQIPGGNYARLGDLTATEARRIGFGRGQRYGPDTELSPEQRRRMARMAPDRLRELDEAGRQRIVDQAASQQMSPAELKRMFTEALRYLKSIAGAMGSN